MNRYQKAAAVWNNKQIQIAKEKYYQNPKICRNCGEIIHLKDGQKPSEINRKKYCDSSCAAKYNNTIRIRIKKERFKIDKKPPFEYLNGVTKGQFLDKKGIYHKYRAIIRKHAQWIYKQNKGDEFCKVCGYMKHIEVAHIKSVSMFSNDTLITDINDFNNLVGLCPNHHWEFDNGIVEIGQVSDLRMITPR